MPAPIPFDAPVTTATLFFSMLMCLLRAEIVMASHFDVRLIDVAPSRKGSASGLNFSQVIPVSIEDIAPQREFGELAFPDDGNQPGCLQFFDVMRDRCGHPRLTLPHID